MIAGASLSAKNKRFFKLVPLPQIQELRSDANGEQPTVVALNNPDLKENVRDHAIQSSPCCRI